MKTTSLIKCFWYHTKLLQAVEVDLDLTTMNYFFVVVNEELDEKAFEQEVWKEGNLLLVKSNTPDPTKGSCSSMNVELLIRMPDHITVSFVLNSPTENFPSKKVANIFRIQYLVAR